MVPAESSNEALEGRASSGDETALGELFARYRPRLRAMVQLRLDPRLRGRVDPSDVLQEAFLEASQRLTDYAARPTMPLFLWLRFLTSQRVLQMHRRHLETQKRSAHDEISIGRGAGPDASTLMVAEQLVGTLTSPSVAAVRGEVKLRLQAALESMDSIDREILVLRHFEELSNNEAAQVLAISKTACSNRYIRALGRLKQVLGDSIDASH